MKIKRIFLLLSICFLSLPTYSQDKEVSHGEPNIKKALSWWPDQINVWTPVGWKDHSYRFDVVYNGDILAVPAPRWGWPRENSSQWIGKDMMLKFSFHADGKPVPIPEKRIPVYKTDGGHGIQGWDKDHVTPVLWTDYRLPRQGCVIRQDFFAHMKGGKAVKTALEPLYGWVQLKVIFTDPVRHADSIPVVIRLNRTYYDHYDHGVYAVSLDINPALKKYYQELHGEKIGEKGQQGLKVLEPDGKVRMMVIPGSGSGKPQFLKMEDGVYAVKFFIKNKVGSDAKVLLPMISEAPSTLRDEVQLGYAGALQQSDIFWQQKDPHAATVKVPEKFITNAISQSIKLAENITEKDYKTHQYSYLTGSFGYDYLWATPTSMLSFMFMDPLGQFDNTKKYSEIFLKNQGTIKPPGNAYHIDSGYYSTPKTLTSINWLTDHGAILLQVTNHALLSGDKQFIKHWLPSILKACDFIKEACAITDFEGVKGLMPPAVGTDEGIQGQYVWSMAWTYKGLTSAVKLLEQIKDPRAAEFKAFAARFKKIFREQYTKIVKQGNTWTDEHGKVRFLPPTVLSNKPQPHHIFSDAFYLDTGPMVLVWSGLMDARDPIMQDMLYFFRNGPNKKMWRPLFYALDPPWLHHEISTCEPCYSWNVFYSWELDDREHFLEGMYSLYAGALSHNTYISCEHRDGIQGNLFATPLAFYLTRLAVIDDQIRDNELHLMRICPLAWITSTEETVFDNMPTEFGPVSLEFRKSKDGKTLDVKFKSDWRYKPDKVVLHIPPVPGLKTIKVNDRSYSIENKKEIVLR
jgi:hypothetical protein